MAVREAVEDTEVQGTLIKKGTVLQLLPIALNKSMELWGPDAEEFKPERWNGKQSQNAYGYMTFLQGTRSCVGRK